MNPLPRIDREEGGNFNDFSLPCTPSCLCQEEHPLTLWLIKIGGVGVGDDGHTGFAGKIRHPALHHFLRIAGPQMALLQDLRVHIRSDGHIKSDQSSAEKKRLVRSHLEPHPFKVLQGGLRCWKTGDILKIDIIPHSLGTGREQQDLTAGLDGLGRMGQSLLGLVEG